MCKIDGAKRDDMFMETSAVCEIDYESIQRLLSFYEFFTEVQGIIAFGFLFYQTSFILGTLTFVLHWINYTIILCFYIIHNIA
jgi:hypothetical protein